MIEPSKVAPAQASRPSPDTALVEHKSALGVTTDVEAVGFFLDHVGARNARTRREYEREVGRLMVWLNCQRLTLHRLTYAALREYLLLLGDEAALTALAMAQPTRERRAMIERSFAVGEYRVRRHGRPLPISPARARNARPVLLSLFSFLSENGHRAPLGVPRIAKDNGETTDRVERAREAIAKRKLNSEQWDLIDRAIAAMSWEDRGTVTARTMLIWLRWSGARRAEFDGAKTDDITVAADASGRQWHFWKVRGKGGKVREVPLNSAMITAYRQYANTLEYVVGSDTLGIDASRPLFEMAGRTPKSSPRAATGHDLYLAVRQLAASASTIATTPFDRERTLYLTPHWFRHRRAFELQESVSLAVAAQLLGHASVNTTLIYSHAAAIDVAKRVYPDEANCPLS